MPDSSNIVSVKANQLYLDIIYFLAISALCLPGSYVHRDPYILLVMVIGILFYMPFLIYFPYSDTLKVDDFFLTQEVRYLIPPRKVIYHQIPLNNIRKIKVVKWTTILNHDPPYVSVAIYSRAGKKISTNYGLRAYETKHFFQIVKARMNREEHLSKYVLIDDKVGILKDGEI